MFFTAKTQFFSQVVKREKGKNGCHTIKGVNNFFKLFFLGKTYPNVSNLFMLLNSQFTKILELKCLEEALSQDCVHESNPPIGP